MRIIFRQQEGVVILFNVSSVKDVATPHTARLTHMSFRLCYFCAPDTPCNELEDTLSGDINAITYTTIHSSRNYFNFNFYLKDSRIPIWQQLITYLLLLLISLVKRSHTSFRDRIHWREICKRGVKAFGSETRQVSTDRRPRNRTNKAVHNPAFRYPPRVSLFATWREPVSIRKMNLMTIRIQTILLSCQWFT